MSEGKQSTHRELGLEAELPVQEVMLAADSRFLNYGEAVIRAAASGIDDATRVSGRQARFHTDALEASATTDEMLAAFRLPNDQINADRLYGRLEQAGVGYEMPFVLYTSEDLRTATTNFVFGFAVSESGISVQSIARFARDISNPSTLTGVIRHISRHEFGHMLGLDDSTIKRQDNGGVVRKGHCANTCTMQQVTTTSQAIRLTRQLLDRPNAGFCADCVDVLSHR
jgi:predicted Zn-dependent protease